MSHDVFGTTWTNPWATSDHPTQNDLGCLRRLLGIQEVNIQFSEHSGTPDDFIARLRRELDEDPKDDLRLFSLAMWLFMASRYQESTQVAASVCRPGYEIEAGEELGNRLRAHQEIRAALERVELIIESEYAASGATVDDIKIALAQFQWMKRTVADAE